MTIQLILIWPFCLAACSRVIIPPGLAEATPSYDPIVGFLSGDEQRGFLKGARGGGAAAAVQVNGYQ